MTTVVNNTTPTQTPAPAENGGTGFLIGAIILAVFVAVFIFYGIPAIRQMGPIRFNVPAPVVNVQSPQVSVPAPQISVPAPQIVVPDKVDVTVTPAN